MTRLGFFLALALAFIVATVAQVDARKGNVGGGTKAPKTTVAPSGKLVKQPIGSGKPKPSKTTTPIAQGAPKLPKGGPKKGLCVRNHDRCASSCRGKNKEACEYKCLAKLDRCLPPSKH